MIVHQLLSGAGPVDAVTGQARQFRDLFDRWGWRGGDFAAYLDPRMDGAVAPLSGLVAGPGDLLLFHYSAYSPKLTALLELPNPKLLVSHNITPAHYFWDHEPTIAINCAIGRAQLPQFAQAVDLAAGVSEYNTAELRNAGARHTTVLPILFDRDRLPAPGEADRARPPTILCVGRLTPHKRQDDVLRAFALYRRHHAPDARLMLVGEPLTPRYEAAVRELADELAPGAVTIESNLAAAKLWERYRRADALISLSEHEGFCIPLLEAFHFGVPVVARAAGGVPEVAADAALLVDLDEELAVATELLALAISDDELRAELRRRGRARLADYEFERGAQRLREAVESLSAE
ncbi:MAG TPA: glycosyltransferase [Solirubrobacteraceae bacterium]|nr:glycosyltransferase [Solirubrobacteraceae bacterium]